MCKLFRLFTAVLLVCSVLSSAAGAEDASDGGNQIYGYGSIGWFTNYVCRGQKLSEGSVVQPSAGIKYGGFGIDLWANYDTHLNEHNETDFTVSYERSFGRLALNGGWIYYAIEDFPDTQEVFVSAKYNSFLSPCLTYFHDFDEGEGGYLVASVGHEFPLWNEISLELGASASMNFENAYLGTDENGDEFTGLYNGEIGAKLTVPLFANGSIAGYLAYSFPLGTDAKNAIRGFSYDQDDQILYGGATVSIAF